MKYKSTTIAPAGRNKYGNYMSKGNVTKSVVMTTYAGNDTTTTIGGGNKDEDTGTTTFYAMLSITNITFSALDLINGASAATQVIAYQGYNKAVTLVCDMDAVSATTRDDGSIESLQAPANSGITTIPAGMQVVIENNGTNNAKIVVWADNTIPDNGTLNIPVCVYKRDDDIPTADLYNWYDHAYQRDENNVYYSTNNCEVVWLELAWNVNRTATSNYQMDLSNERAGVNVSATTQSGDILYPNSIASLVCTASTHLNGDIVTGITYSLSQLSLTRFNARGVAIVNENNVGKLVFTSAGTNSFNFNGPTLPLDIVATLDGEDIATKTMTIDKNYPGADGQAAVTRWVVSDHDVIHYNPNTKDINPMVINAWVMKQIGGDEPFKESGTTLVYYSYNGVTPTQTLPFNSDWVVSAKTYYTGNTGNIPVSSLTFALKNGGGVIYESEEIPCMWDGLNGAAGASGATGASGKNGTDGVDGQSAWYLTLDNDNASVNANASGVIYTQAIKPACHAKLYYGSQKVTNAKYVVDWGTASGITSAVSSSGILTIDTDHDDFNFTDDVLSIYISGYSGSTSTEVRDVKVFNITKSKAGAAGTNGETPYISGGTWWIGGVDTGISAEGENGCTPEIIDGYWWICGENTGVKAEGTDAVSYWLSLDYTSVIFNRNDSGYSPSSITATAYRQVGEDPFTPAPDVKIAVTYRKRNTGTWTGLTSATTNSLTKNVTTKQCVDNDRIRFTLYKGANQIDQEDVDILCDGMDGKNGENGAQGRQGPAIRGPFDYYEVSASTQCWCAGESGSSCQECDRWIDIVLKDGKFYMCSKTYTGRCATDYSKGIGSSYWTESDNFDFVATRVLLASAASINFLTNNWLYLKDENGNIVGGARGTSVDSGITFWSGSEDPEDATFKVDYEGNLYAKQGTFAGYVQYPYVYVDTMMPNFCVSATSVSARYLSDTNWQGRKAEAPKEPVSGMCYANTTEHKIYFYTNRWVQVFYENGDAEGYLADNHAYLLADNMIGTYHYSAGTAQSQHLILPEPSSALNGFTYDIVTYPDYATRTRGSEQVAILSLITMNKSAKFYVAAFAADDDVAATLWKRIEFYAGHVKITCMPKRTDVGGSVVTEYIWVLTMCTAGMTTYNNNDMISIKGAYGPIFGYSPTDNYYVPVKLQTESNPNSNSRMRNTIYITL